MKPTIICLTPIKNEAWILDTFLQATSLWADFIIIADQQSTDGSRQIAQKYKKVILVENNSNTYDEAERQRLLISEARKIAAPRLLITLDADEIFTPNVMHSEEWKMMLKALPGTIFKFQWVNLRPDFKTFWYGYYFPWGFMDNGFEYDSLEKIHTTRIPFPPDAESIEINNIKVIHLQYTNWKRMQSKHRWYQCYEHVSFPDKSPVIIFRLYHHMYAFKKNEINDIPKSWIIDYKNYGINIDNFNDSEVYWWDEKVIEYFDQYGTDYFQKMYVWNINWNKIAKKIGRKNINYGDPRTLFDKLFHFFLIHTQKNKDLYLIRKTTNLLRKILSY